MDEFTKNLGSIGWWLGVVLVGVLLNVLSAYLKPALDVPFSKVSSWWRNRSEKERAARFKLLMKLRGDKHEQLMMQVKANRCYLRAIVYFLSSLTMFVMHFSMMIGASSSSTGFFVPRPFWRQFAIWFSVLAAFLTMRELISATRLGSLVEEAQEKDEAKF